MSTLLFVDQIADYFVDLIDEPDETFATTALMQSWLELGYWQYWQLVTDQNPERFAAQHTMTLTNASEYDLNGVLLGAAAPNRMLQLLRIVRVNSNGVVTEHLHPKSNFEQLDTYQLGQVGFTIQARKIYFSAEITGDFRIDYIPVPTVDWTRTTSGDNEFVDDMINFHDLIALFAAQQYFAADNQPNPMIDRLLLTRQKAFLDHIQRGRNVTANRFVQDEDPWY